MKTGQRRNSDGNDQERKHGDELHESVQPEIVGEPPPDHTGDSDKYQGNQQRSLIHGKSQEGHEYDRHGQPVPEQACIVGSKMVVA